MKLALIPARSGSKRFPNKNIKLLNGHPLIAYSIVSAIRSEIFDKVVVCTDSREHYYCSNLWCRNSVSS